MTYTDAFATNIQELSQGYLKFMVSRTFSNPRDNILEMQVPANLPPEFTVELSLFSQADDALIYHASYPSSQQSAFHIRTLQYANSELRKLLFIDFSEIQQNLPIGDFRLVLSFIEEEVGSAEAPILELTAVSPSRQEIELQLSSQYNTEEYQTELMEFARPRITSEWVLVALGQIFGVSLATGMPSDNQILSFSDISKLLPAGLNTDIVSELDSDTQAILETAYEAAKQTVETDILNGKHTFTNVYLKDIVQTAITNSYIAYIEQKQQTLMMAKYVLTSIGGAE